MQHCGERSCAHRAQRAGGVAAIQVTHVTFGAIMGRHHV